MSTPRKANPPRVRLANVQDSVRLAQINRVTWQHAYDGLVPAPYLAALDDEGLQRSWAARLLEPGERPCLVAECDGLVVSYAIGGPYRVQQDAQPEDTTGWGELFALYTDPPYQGRGAGAAALSSLLDVLTERGFVVAALWMLRDNQPARRWYVDHGWRLDGATSTWLGAGEPLPEVRLTRGLTRGLTDSPADSPADLPARR